MAKITTIIDIGSNSMRMVVFKKTSRFGFHLINESKIKVKISQGCYENNGYLQKEPMLRAFETLKSFLNLSLNLKSRKLLCVATSALRDAPNKNDFISKVSKELNLNIKIIDGKKEAYYGGIAALNLLPYKTFTTIDIGGGSCEFSFIQDKNIINTISLKIGTVRLKELYFNRNNLNDAKTYILKELSIINNSLFSKNPVVGLGGTARALSRIILQRVSYPIDTLHGFEYNADENISLFDKIIQARDHKRLKELGVSKDRYDTIVVGTFIWKTILQYFKIQKVITSSVGVREGVYLCDLLRNSNYKFPSNFNISVRSLLDRFIDDKTQSAYLGSNAKKIFNVLQELHMLDKKYNSILVIASKLQLIGISLNFYENEDHAFWYILNGLSYNFTHEDKLLIAIVAKYAKKTLPRQKDIISFEKILPNIETIKWLNFMMTLNSEFSKSKFDYRLFGNELTIKAKKEKYLVKQALQKIETPINLKLTLI